MTVFDKVGSYGFIHHRALNDFTELEKARSLAKKYPQVSHVFEGDICWNFEDGREDLYFRHPSFIIDTLSSDQIDKAVSSNKLVTISTLEELSKEDVFLIIEFKLGRGDKYKAIDKIIEILEEHFSGRYWMDGFSLTLLEYVNKKKPDIPLTLHSELVINGFALVAAPEFSLPKFKRIKDLNSVDGIAIRWHGSNKFMKRSCDSVLDASKILVLSRIHDIRQYKCSRYWFARAGYVHGDLSELFDMEPEILKKIEKLPNPTISRNDC